MHHRSRRPGATGSRRCQGRCAPRPGLLLALLALVLSGCVVIPVGDLLKGPELEEQMLVDGGGFFRREKVAIVDITGVITARESSSLLARVSNTVSETRARLDRIGADREVKALVLRIASPGGEVTACDIIHRDVSELKKSTGIPVVACIMDQGASGGYYVACAADEIVAHPTATVGSIGVILQSFDLSGLLYKLGITVEPVKSSALKDLNSMFRPHSEKERAVLQQLVGDMYDRFVDVVAEGRSELTRPEVLEVADGRVVSGAEAAELDLVDRVGYLDDAVARAAELAGVESPTIVRYTRLPRSGSSIYSLASISPEPPRTALSLSIEPLLEAPRLMYLWKP